jgi:hypothetical protein
MAAFFMTPRNTSATRLVMALGLARKLLSQDSFRFGPGRPRLESRGPQVGLARMYDEAARFHLVHLLCRRISAFSAQPSFRLHKLRRTAGKPPQRRRSYRLSHLGSPNSSLSCFFIFVCSSSSAGSTADWSLSYFTNGGFRSFGFFCFSCLSSEGQYT